MWSVIPIDAGFTVDAHGVLQAVDANSASLELPGSIQTPLLICHIFIIVTVFGFIVAIAFFTLVTRRNGSWPPGLLVVPRTTSVAAVAAGVMFTLTLVFLGSFIPWTATGVAITNTHPSNGNVFY